MNLYYTTTTGYDNVQANPERSLGGFKSSTPVGNDDYGNVFDEISLLTIRNGRDEYRAIMVKNDYSERIENIQIGVTMPENSICRYRLAIGELVYQDKDGRRFMENVNSIYVKPFRGDFIDVTDGATLNFGSLDPGEERGLWICRSIDKEAAKEQYNDVCRPDPKDPTGRRYIKVTHPQEESVGLVVSW